MTLSLLSQLVKQILFVYGCTLIICSSNIFDPIRQWIISQTPMLYSPLSYLFPNYEYPLGIKHFIECRMCVSVWMTLVCCTYYHNPTDFWVIFSTAYILATQER